MPVNPALVKVKVQGRTTDAMTAAAWAHLCRLYGSEPRITQGSYNTSVGASAGTHSGGGALDVEAVKDWERFGLLNRYVGFTGYHRAPIAGLWPEHNHLILAENPALSPQAKAQVVSYLKGRDGLAANGPDTQARPPGAFVPFTFPLGEVVWQPDSTKRAPADVKVMQSQLNRRIDAGLLIDGKWGPVTEAAWQHWMDLANRNKRRAMQLLLAGRADLVPVAVEPDPTPAEPVTIASANMGSRTAQMKLTEFVTLLKGVAVCGTQEFWTCFKAGWVKSLQGLGYEVAADLAKPGSVESAIVYDPKLARLESFGATEVMGWEPVERQGAGGRLHFVGGRLRWCMPPKIVNRASLVLGDGTTLDVFCTHPAASQHLPLRKAHATKHIRKLAALVLGSTADVQVVLTDANAQWLDPVMKPLRDIGMEVLPAGPTLGKRAVDHVAVRGAEILDSGLVTTSSDHKHPTSRIDTNKEKP